jgi:hypothetical protein
MAASLSIRRCRPRSGLGRRWIIQASQPTMQTAERSEKEVDHPTEPADDADRGAV